MVWKINIAFLLMLLTGCTKEDLSGCGIDVAFKYDYNATMTDMFASEVDKIDLYVFDHAGLFVNVFTDEGEHLDANYRMHLRLDPGEYDLIVWGNLRDDYEKPIFIPGVSRLEDARISLKTASGIVATVPSSMFYGSLLRVEIKPSGNDLLLVPLIKNTNAVKVILKGLPIVTRAAVEPALDTAFSCHVTGKNGRYDFGNLWVNRSTLLYLPEYAKGNNQLTADFVTMRLAANDESRLVLMWHSSAGKDEEIFNVSLSQMIKKQYPDVDFDREHEFVLPFDVNYTNGAFTVTMNGWTIVGGGGGIIG